MAADRYAAPDTGEAKRRHFVGPEKVVGQAAFRMKLSSSLTDLVHLVQGHFVRQGQRQHSPSNVLGNAKRAGDSDIGEVGMLREMGLK